MNMDEFLKSLKHSPYADYPMVQKAIEMLHLQQEEIAYWKEKFDKAIGLTK